MHSESRAHQSLLLTFIIQTFAARTLDVLVVKAALGPLVHEAGEAHIAPGVETLHGVVAAPIALLEGIGVAGGAVAPAGLGHAFKEGEWRGEERWINDISEPVFRQCIILHLRA